MEYLTEQLAQQVAKARLVVHEHREIFNGLIAVCAGEECASAIGEEETPIEPSVGGVLALLLAAAGSSSLSLRKVCDDVGLQTLDCYIIARAIVETCVNVCYILAEGPSAAKRALRHARQKSFRDLKRESIIGNSVIRAGYSQDIHPSTIPGLVDDLREFESPRGREKNWTSLSIDDRIRCAGQKLGGTVETSLHVARFVIYRHSSEILHGSLFGIMFFLGATRPNRPRCENERCRNVLVEQSLIMIAVGSAMCAVVAGFHKVYGFGRARQRSIAAFRHWASSIGQAEGSEVAGQWKAEIRRPTTS
jgi:hypothetical protein